MKPTETTTDPAPALTPAALTALRAIKALRQYDLPNLQEAERTVLRKLSAEDMAAVVLALSEPSESLSPVERVNSVLDRLVKSNARWFDDWTKKIIAMRESIESELTTDPKQVRRESELRYRERTREFVRALVRAGLSDNVIAGLWPVFELSKDRPSDLDSRTRHIRQIGKTMVLTSDPDRFDRFELPDTLAVLAHIEVTMDDLEIQDISTLPIDTYRLNFETREAVLHYLRTSGVLDCPEIDVCLSAVRAEGKDGFCIDLTALEIHPEVEVTLSKDREKDAFEIAIAVVKRWKWMERTEEEADTGLTEDQFTRKLEQALRSRAAGPQTLERLQLLCQTAESLLSFVPADVTRARWLDRVTSYGAGDDPLTFEQILQAGESLIQVLDYWKILKK